MTTLKVKIINDVYYPYDKHEFGGTDFKQITLFRHLFPEGYCDTLCEDLLYDLAEAHGWKVELI